MDLDQAGVESLYGSRSNAGNADRYGSGQVAFVYPFWQPPAKYDELRWSIRSIYKHFKGDEFKIIVAGSRPILKRQTESWYSGELIEIPRTVHGSGRVSIEDAAGKFLAALKHPETPERIVWMMDDVFFLRDTTWEELELPRAGYRFKPETVDNAPENNWWRKAKKETAKALIEAGLPTWDFATHLPHAVYRDEVIKAFDRFQIVERCLLWEMIYENIRIAESPQPVTPFLRMISGNKCKRGMESATAKATVLNVAGNGWTENLRSFLYSHLPEKSPLETDELIPPKPWNDEPKSAAIEAPVVHRSRPLVTCVLNAWGRPKAFPCQMESMRKQTIANELLVWQNAHDPTRHEWQRDWFDAGQMTHGSCNQNLGVWARFAFALNARTEFVCVFDDDIFPGNQWLEHCIETIKKHDGLLGGNGVIFHSQTDYNKRTNYGWAFPNRFAVHVDIVGHAWFVRREWLGLYWSEMPDLSQPIIAGEDFHFSYMLQKHGIKTFVPQHRIGQQSKWSCESPKKGKAFGRSEVALSKHRQHSQTIRNGLSLYVEKGFRLIQDATAPPGLRVLPV